MYTAESSVKMYACRKATNSSRHMIETAASTEISPIIVSVGKYSVAIRTGYDAEALQAVLHVLGDLQ